jgi:hypothetical protein
MGAIPKVGSCGLILTASADEGGEWAEGHYGGARMRTGKCSQHPSKMGGTLDNLIHSA